MRALILVDIQNDFIPGGALAVPDGNAVVGVANRLMRDFELVVATQDWHPQGHGSFASNHPGKRVGDVIDLEGIEQVLWPDHCVRNSAGAEFAPGLDTGGIGHVIRKGTDPAVDSYSTFFDNAHRRDTGLHDFLQERDVDTVYLMGLATDYCVKFSVLDARGLGYETVVVEDGCRGIDLEPGDVDRAFEAMRAAGAMIVNADDIESQ